MLMRRAVFLDRDGVLNSAVVRQGVPYPPAGPDEVEITEGAPGALAALKAAGFLLIVVTNQPDVARGTARREIVESMNARVAGELGIDDVLVCYHDDRHGCDCRKPRPGLLERAARTHSIDLARSFMVGDRWKDVEAGRRAGCVTVFIDHGYAEPGPATPDCSVGSLVEAVQWIVSKVEAGA